MRYNIQARLTSHWEHAAIQSNVAPLRFQPKIDQQSQALLKCKSFQKTEIFIYESNQIDLDTTQKMKISEYVSLIKNKPIKIHIKSSLFEDDLKINKSRTLLVRAFLVKLGISHNRIKIDFEKEFNDINKDEIAISFIEI
mgnify:CR=1 FL=1